MGSREQAGKSGNGKWENKKWELLRGCNLKSLWVLKIENKTNSACIFTLTRIKGCGG